MAVAERCVLCQCEEDISFRPDCCCCVSFCGECEADPATLERLANSEERFAGLLWRAWDIHSKFCRDAECECDDWMEPPFDRRPICPLCRGRFERFVKERRTSLPRAAKNKKRRCLCEDWMRPDWPLPPINLSPFYLNYLTFFPYVKCVFLMDKFCVLFNMGYLFNMTSFIWLRA